MIDWVKLQQRLGVTADGIAGRGTFTALFKRLGAKQDIAEEFALAVVVLAPDFATFESPLRLAHFLGQLSHESGGFIYMEEIASGAAYEGRKDLGNTEPGDGRRYKGHGPIQITGRANHRTYGRKIGIDLERHPEVAAIPSIGMRTALEYWKDHKLDALADHDDIEGITRRINGGLNGLTDRKVRTAKVKELLL